MAAQVSKTLKEFIVFGRGERGNRHTSDCHIIFLISIITLTRFSIGISEAANAKQQLQVNDTISGECLSVLESDKEPVDYYKVSKHLSLGEVHRFFRTLMQLRCHPGAERI